MKRFQYCLNSDGFIHYIRAIQGHYGAHEIDPSLLDNVKILCMWSEYIYHVGSSLCTHSIFHLVPIAGGKYIKEGRQTVFFTAVDPMSDFQEEEEDHDLTKPRQVQYKTKWKVFQDAIYWINLKKCSRLRISILANWIRCHYP